MSYAFDERGFLALLGSCWCIRLLGIVVIASLLFSTSSSGEDEEEELDDDDDNDDDDEEGESSDDDELDEVEMSDVEEHDFAANEEFLRRLIFTVCRVLFFELLLPFDFCLGVF